jgi:CRISPR/Cas system-associated endonuclease Cas1
MTYKYVKIPIENISSIIISTFLKFLISFNLINLLQERVISEIFMFAQGGNAAGKSPRVDQ